MNNFLPNGIFAILQLAAVLVFLIVSLAAIVSIFFTRDNGFIYLWSQLALLFFFMSLSRDWLYGWIFAGLFESVENFARITMAVGIGCSAFFVNTLFRVFLWEGKVFTKQHAKPPGLLVGVVAGLIYLVASLIILQFVFDQSITAIATLSGAAAVVLGFSAQSTLGEMFSGIALTISRPFKVGDWIKVAQMDEGQVIDQTWRHVILVTREDVELILTNSCVAQNAIKNLSRQAQSSQDAV